MLWAQDTTPLASGPNTAETPPARVPPDSSTLLATRVIKPIYPIAGEQEKLEGLVVLKIAVSETGDVEGVEVVNGNPVLAQAATDAAKEWKFKPFIRNGKAAKTATNLSFNFVFRDQIPDSSVTTGGLPQGAPATLDLTTVRLSRELAQKMVLQRVEPVYPEFAKVGRIQGSVLIFAVVGKDGTITVLHLISGHPLLAPAALKAVKGWRYRPYILNDEPVEFQTTITVSFVLR